MGRGARVQDGGYVGRLDNDPGYARNLKADDRLSFRPEHVAARDAREGDPLYTDPVAFAVVSGRVWNDDAWPHLGLSDGRSQTRRFSGWFVFAGDESESYLADPANFVPVAQATLFDRFRVLDPGLEGPVGTTMMRQRGGARVRGRLTTGLASSSSAAKSDPGATLTRW